MKPLMEHAVHPLAERPCLFRPASAAGAGDALDHHGEALVAQVERHAGQQMGGADRARSIRMVATAQPALAGRATYMAMVSGSAASGRGTRSRQQASKPRQAHR